MIDGQEAVRIANRVLRKEGVLEAADVIATVTERPETWEITFLPRDVEILGGGSEVVVSKDDGTVRSLKYLQ